MHTRTLRPRRSLLFRLQFVQGALHTGNTHTGRHTLCYTWSTGQHRRTMPVIHRAEDQGPVADEGHHHHEATRENSASREER